MQFRKCQDHWSCKRNRFQEDFGRNSSYQWYQSTREYGKLQDAPESLTNRGREL